MANEGDPYVYLGTSVLKNKFNTKNPRELDFKEARATLTRMIELEQKPLKGDFDFKHLKDIHAYIYQDVWAWAGEPRTVAIAKADMFAMPQFIEPFANDIFKGLKKDDHLKNLPQEQFVEKVTELFADVNACHPFREGNGRTQRVFITQLAHKSGYAFDWTRVSQDQMIDASIHSMSVDNSKLETLFAEITSPIQEKRITLDVHVN